MKPPDVRTQQWQHTGCIMVSPEPLPGWFIFHWLRPTTLSTNVSNPRNNMFYCSAVPESIKPQYGHHSLYFYLVGPSKSHCLWLVTRDALSLSLVSVQVLMVPVTSPDTSTGPALAMVLLATSEMLNMEFQYPMSRVYLVTYLATCCLNFPTTWLL